MSIPLQMDSKSQSKRQSHPNELSKNRKNGDVLSSRRWKERDSE